MRSISSPTALELRSCAPLGLLTGARPPPLKASASAAAWPGSTSDVDADVEPMPCASSAAIFGSACRSGSASKCPSIATPRRSSSSTRRSPRHPSRPRCSSPGGRQLPAVSPRRPGWYKRKRRAHRGPGDDSSVSTTEFGWHAGGGIEVFAGQALRHPRRLSLHLPRLQRRRRRGHRRRDRRGVIGGLLPGHKGSMWTVGVTVYF